MILLSYFFLIFIFFISVKLNANRQVAGVLRGFDPFMNLVLDETVEKIKDGVVNNIGMVVCLNIKPKLYPDLTKYFFAIY